MASARHILHMIHSVGDGDDVRFMAIAETVADEARKAGRTKMADDIEIAVSRARRKLTGTRQHAFEKSVGLLRITQQSNKIAAPPGNGPGRELGDIIGASRPTIRLDDVIVRPELTTALRKLVREHEENDRLMQAGFPPRRKILLVGPSGTGKTMTAAALAAELGAPLYVVHLDGLVSKHLGETGAKLRLVFDAMYGHPGVYLFDEIDAITGRRDNGNDVGEAKRILNNLLVMMDEDRSGSVIVAATNHPELMDSAIFRRFDLRLSYELPERHHREELIQARLATLDTDAVDWTDLSEHHDGFSQSDLRTICEDAGRAAVLDNDGVVSTEIVKAALDARRKSPGNGRIDVLPTSQNVSA